MVKKFNESSILENPHHLKCKSQTRGCHKGWLQLDARLMQADTRCGSPQPPIPQPLTSHQKLPHFSYFDPSETNHICPSPLPPLNISVTKQKQQTDMATTLSLCYFCSEMTHPCHLSTHQCDKMERRLKWHHLWVTEDAVN